MLIGMERAQSLMSRGAEPSDELVSILLYKRWAGRYVAAIMRHVHTVDCIFRAHLLGTSHTYTSANPEEPRTLGELDQRMAATDDWYVEYARSLDARRLGEALDVTFTDGDRQRLTRWEVLLHVSHHGAYHRGNVGILLRIAGAGALPDRFTSYLRTAGSSVQIAR
jgi:uncharacterized damage-inducible protein DinB